MSVLDELAVKAGDDDVVGGVPARLVAAPASTAQAAALVAASRGLSVVIRGGGTKLHQGPPPRRLDLIIDTRRLTGVVEHAAGDLITVVRGGTPMTELHRLPGQQLALDAPFGATAGGTVAANASGPRRLRYGTARDLLIGITVVRPDGRIAKAGGKVVKNVAGYDLGKLYTGSHGTLGLITECVFRLHPVPVTTSFVRAVAPPSAAAAVLAARFAPSALEMNAGPGTDPEIAVLLEGTPDGVHHRATELAALLGGEITSTPPDWWDTPPWMPGGLALKLTATLSRVPALVTAALEAGLTIRGSVGTGVLYAGAGTPSIDDHTPDGTATPHPSPVPASAEQVRTAAGIAESLRTVAGAPDSPSALAGAPDSPSAVAGAPDSPSAVAGSADTSRAVGSQGKFPRVLGDSPEPLRTAASSADPRRTTTGRAEPLRSAVNITGPLRTTADIVASLRSAATAAGGHAVVLAVPEGQAHGIDMWGLVPGLELMRRVKEQFDPDHRFAPGRFVGGI